jgi:hypothetical protein
VTAQAKNRAEKGLKKIFILSMALKISIYFKFIRCNRAAENRASVNRAYTK